MNEFSVEVPTAIADDIQIDGPNIKERTRTDQKDAQRPAIGRKRPGKSLLQEKVLGPYALKLSYDAPRADQKAGEIAPAALQEIRPLNVFRETGQVAVIKDGNLEFTKTDAKGLELIDPKELQSIPPLVTAFSSPINTAAHPIALTPGCLQKSVFGSARRPW